MSGKGRTGHARYRRNRARILKESDVCWLCGQWIDPDLKFPDPLCATADHVHPVGKGGDNNGELRPAHFRCNILRNKKQTPKKETPHGRDW